MKAAPQQEHRWLEQLLGEWAVTSDMGADGGSPWIERVRSLDGLWIVAEAAGEMLGGAGATTIMTLGYDPRRQCYVGSWVGSMMTHMWVYEGHLDAGSTALTLDCEGEDFEQPGRVARYQDIITIKSRDHRLLTARMQSADGSWKQIMEAEYRRR